VLPCAIMVSGSEVALRVGFGATLCLAPILLGLVAYTMTTQYGPLGKTPSWLEFKLHPLLMTLAFGFFGPLAAVCYKGLEPLGVSHSTAKFLHAFLMGSACLCALLGILDMWLVHQKAGKAHLSSVHSLSGLPIACAFGLNFLLGLFSFTPLNSSGFINRAAIKPLHVFLGMCTVFGTLATVGTGVLSLQGGANIDGSPKIVLLKLAAMVVFALMASIALVFFAASPRNKSATSATAGLSAVVPLID